MSEQPAGYSDKELAAFLQDPQARQAKIGSLRRYLADRNREDSPKQASYARKLAELEHLNTISLRPESN